MFSRYFSAAASTLVFLIAAKSCPQAIAASDKTCDLVARLGFPGWDNSNDVPYFGFHADWLEAWYDEDDFCDAEVSASWCRYQNSNPLPGSQSAFIANPDQNEDLVDWTKQEESITVSSAAGKTTNFIVYHWYFENDYYTDNSKWKDHMLAATLSIKSNGNTVRDSDGNAAWTHPVDLDVTTHIEGTGSEEGMQLNPDYQDKFGISVTCDADCNCEAGGYTLTFDESDHKDGPGPKKKGLSGGGKAAIGILCTALILAPVSYFLYKKKRKSHNVVSSVQNLGPNNIVYTA